MRNRVTMAVLAVLVLVGLAATLSMAAGPKQYQWTGTVTDVDAKAKKVTVRGEKGQMDLDIRDPEQLKLIKKGDQIQATYNEALAIDPYDYVALLSKGAILERMGDEKEACFVYRNALKIAPPDEHLPPGLKPPTDRARQIVAKVQAALEEHLRARTGAVTAQVSDAARRRFDESIGILSGRVGPLPPRHRRREADFAEHGDGVVGRGGRRSTEAVEALPQRVEPGHRVLVEHLDDDAAPGGRGQGAQERRQVDDVVQHVVRHDHVGLPRFRRGVGPLAEDDPGRHAPFPGGGGEDVEHVTLPVDADQFGRALGEGECRVTATTAHVEYRAPWIEHPQPRRSRRRVRGRRGRHEPRRIVLPRVPVDAGPDLRRDSPPRLQLGPPLRRTAVRHVSSVEGRLPTQR